MGEDESKVNAALHLDKRTTTMISRHARVANALSRTFLKSFTSQPSRVLVLYTGGTIGMELSPEGYRPKYNYLTSFLRSNALFHDARFAASINLEPDMLVTPELGKRIAYRVEEYKTLLDSSNMNMSNWVQIATSIAQSYDHYDGFVASALSFMLRNLGKTVELTGSQVPLTEQLNDGQHNLLGE